MIQNNMVFSYRLGNAACCQYGQYEGFSVKIYNDCILEYSEYVVQNIEIKKVESEIDIDILNEIKKSINECNIEKIPQNLDNGSSDGDLNEFIFQKNNTYYKITAWNIIDEDYDDKKFKSIKSQKYSENYYYECMVIKLFHNICEILKEKNYDITLFGMKNN